MSLFTWTIAIDGDPRSVVCSLFYQLRDERGVKELLQSQTLRLTLSFFDVLVGTVF